jgi:hypothetical protein
MEELSYLMACSTVKEMVFMGRITISQIMDIE